MGEVIKLFIYFIIFYIFSAIPYFMIAMIFFSTIRVIAGGYHEETYWGCFFITLLLLSAIIIVGAKVPLNTYIRIAMLVVSIVLAWIYAPVDHPNKPIISSQRRKRFKHLSVLIIVLLGSISFLLPIQLGITAVTAIFMETATLPVGHLVNFRRKGVEADEDFKG